MNTSFLNFFIRSSSSTATSSTLLLFVLCHLLSVVVVVVNAYSVLNGVMVTPVSPTAITKNKEEIIHEQSPIDIGQWLTSSSSSSSLSYGRTILIFGTYAADFNMIEYGQQLRYYLPQLLQQHQQQQQQQNDSTATTPMTKCGIIINCHNSYTANQWKSYIDLPPNDDIELFFDPTGIAGKTFGVSRGWLPNNTFIHPYIKLFGMLFGFGAAATLPNVIAGYIGNPFIPKQLWITDALTVGNIQNRWPMNAIEMEMSTVSSSSSSSIVNVKSKFDDLPLVGKTWGRRPLELATLRLQSMMGISIAHWDELQPNNVALQAGVLTQLGGCLIVDYKNNNNNNNETTSVLYDWKDPGICAVANFDDIVLTLEKTNKHVKV